MAPYSRILLISLAESRHYLLALLSLLDMSFEKLHLLQTSWPTKPIPIRLISDFSVPKTFQLICLAFFIWMLLRSHMVDLIFALLTWTFCLLFFFPSLGSFGLYQSPSLCVLPLFDLYLGRGPT